MLNSINMQDVMLSPMKKFSERLRKAIDDTGKNQSWLAKTAGVTRASVTTWLKSDDCNLTSENLAAVARALQVRQEWLQYGEMPMRRGTVLGFEPPELVYAGVTPVNSKLPIVGTAQMGENGYYEQLSSSSSYGDGYLIHFTGDPDAYCLKVKGDSMSPAIRDGWFVVVEPNGQPHNGEPALVQLKDGRKMVKEFLFKKADSIELMSVNGERRLSLDLSEVESVFPISAILPPSRKREY